MGIFDHTRIVSNLNSPARSFPGTSRIRKQPSTPVGQEMWKVSKELAQGPSSAGLEDWNLRDALRLCELLREASSVNVADFENHWPNLTNTCRSGKVMLCWGQSSAGRRLSYICRTALCASLVLHLTKCEDKSFPHIEVILYATWFPGFKTPLWKWPESRSTGDSKDWFGAPVRTRSRETVGDMDWMIMTRLAVQQDISPTKASQGTSTVQCWARNPYRHWWTIMELIAFDGSRWRYHCFNHSPQFTKYILASLQNIFSGSRGPRTWKVLQPCWGQAVGWQRPQLRIGDRPPLPQLMYCQFSKAWED